MLPNVVVVVVIRVIVRHCMSCDVPNLRPAPQEP
jgi:hypothetical protein